MPPQQTTNLTEIFSDVLADLAFMMIDDEQLDPPSDTEILETRIEYSGPNRGALKLYCTREFSRTLAGNLLGIDTNDPDVEARAEDAVKEFMNIICGQTVTRLFGTEDVYDLSIPQVDVTFLTSDNSRNDSPDVANLNIEGEWIQLRHDPE